METLPGTPTPDMLPTIDQSVIDATIGRLEAWANGVTSEAGTPELVAYQAAAAINNLPEGTIKARISTRISTEVGSDGLTTTVETEATATEIATNQPPSAEAIGGDINAAVIAAQIAMGPKYYIDEPWWGENVGNDGDVLANFDEAYTQYVREIDLAEAGLTEEDLYSAATDDEQTAIALVQRQELAAEIASELSAVTVENPDVDSQFKQIIGGEYTEAEIASLGAQMGVAEMVETIAAGSEDPAVVAEDLQAVVALAIQRPDPEVLAQYTSQLPEETATVIHEISGLVGRTAPQGSDEGLDTVGPDQNERAQYIAMALISRVEDLLGQTGDDTVQVAEQDTTKPTLEVVGDIDEPTIEAQTEIMIADIEAYLAEQNSTTENYDPTAIEVEQMSPEMLQEPETVVDALQPAASAEANSQQITSAQITMAYGLAVLAQLDPEVTETVISYWELLMAEANRRTDSLTATTYAELALN